MNILVKELVISFGFLNGIWFAIGTSPEEEVLKFLNRYSMSMPPVLQKLLIILPIILVTLTIITMIKVYYKGGILGSIIVLMAFFAGAIILKNWKIGAVLAILSLLLGLISFKYKRKR
ncbi:MAG: hypothetical protein ACP5OA_06525 [Candidatus Woesearchaeota archaeon]